MSYPNQRKIKVKRYSERVQKDFFKISNRNLQIAMYNLKGNTFKLYCYLADNKNGYEMDLYPCDFQKIANVSYDTYKRSFNELLEQGFLLRHKSDSNIFMFVEESTKKLDCPIDENDQIESIREEDFEKAKDDFCGEQQSKT